MVLELRTLPPRLRLPGWPRCVLSWIAVQSNGTASSTRAAPTTRKGDLMRPEPKQVYPRRLTEPSGSKEPGVPPNLSAPEAVGDRELPDANPNESQRRALKDLARSLRPRFSSRELAYLAGAVEAEANLVRAAEGTGRW